jgi:hypothetical protein
MHAYQRTRARASRVRLTLRRLLRATLVDSCDVLVALGRALSIRCGFHSQLKRLAKTLGFVRVVPSPTQIAQAGCCQGRCSIERKPLIFASACVDEAASGGWKYNGGIKELNLLVKLLRNHGYEAHMVTYDGKYEPWLIQHQPHIALGEFRSMLKTADLARCVTSWALASSFIKESRHLYFWDMELTYTDHAHFSALTDLYEHKIKNVAAISRTIQAWHMSHFERPCIVIPNLLDESLWFQDEQRRRQGRIGYMYEGAHTEECIRAIREKSNSEGRQHDFLLIRGSEAEVLSGMQSCDVFLAMNVGKDPLWGEGCPRTTIEALSTGCVVLAFDIIGNREIIQNNFNGILIPRYRPDLMADSLIDLYKATGEINRLRRNAQSIINHCHTLESRWPAVRDFLDLPNN